MFSLVLLLTGSGRVCQKTRVMDPVQLETFKGDLGRETDGLRAMEEALGLMLHFSPDIVGLSVQVSHC